MEYERLRKLMAVGEYSMSENDPQGYKWIFHNTGLRTYLSQNPKHPDQVISVSVGLDFAAIVTWCGRVEDGYTVTREDIDQIWIDFGNPVVEKLKETSPMTPDEVQEILVSLASSRPLAN